MDATLLIRIVSSRSCGPSSMGIQSAPSSCVFAVFYAFAYYLPRVLGFPGASLRAPGCRFALSLVHLRSIVVSSAYRTVPMTTAHMVAMLLIARKAGACRVGPIFEFGLAPRLSVRTHFQVHHLVPATGVLSTRADGDGVTRMLMRQNRSTCSSHAGWVDVFDSSYLRLRPCTSLNP